MSSHTDVAYWFFGWAVTLLLLYVSGTAIRNAYFHPLAKFPGPKLYAVSHIPIMVSLLTGRLPYTLKELNEKYGDVVRVAPDDLVFSSAAAAKDMYGRTGLRKSARAYNTPPNGTDSILTALDNADHARHRRVLAHAFSEKSLRDQEPLVMGYIDLLMSKLHETAGRPQDMVSWYNFVSFDIIGDLTLGESFGCLKNSELHPWVSLLFRYFKVGSNISAFKRLPFVTKLIPFLMPKSLVKTRTQHSAFTREKVMKRMEGGTERPDFMTNVLKYNEKEAGLSQNEIISTFGLLLLAGSETTATLLSAVTYYLLMNQEVMRKLVAEIRGTFKTEKDITMVSVNQLTYEIAVLEEAMRLQPPVPSGSIRITPKEGASVGGHWVPGNTTVQTAAYSTNHQKRNFKDPDSFVPERWLDDPRYQSDNKTAFTPFSLGPRNCIGRNLAYAEMRVILARILWNFDLELEERSRMWAVDMKMFLLWEKPPLYVTLTPVVRE